MLYGAQIKSQPSDEQAPALLGFALALAGRYPEAAASAERAIAMASKTRGDVNLPYAKDLLARIYILAGDQEKAPTLIDQLLSDRYSLSPRWLRIDPIFAPLRGSQRFERLVKAGN